jgi:hypothetical protein
LSAPLNITSKCNIVIKEYSNGKENLVLNPRCTKKQLEEELINTHIQYFKGKEFLITYQMIDFASYEQFSDANVNINVIDYIIDQESSNNFTGRVLKSNFLFKEAFLSNLNDFSWFRMLSRFFVKNGCEVVASSIDAIKDGKMNLMSKREIVNIYKIEHSRLTKSHYSTGFDYTIPISCI